MDDLFMEPLDIFAYGDGLNASRYSEYLQEQHGIGSDCYIQSRPYYGGSVDDGMVTYAAGAIRDAGDSFLPEQSVTVRFYSDDLNICHVAVSVDLFTKGREDSEALLPLFHGGDETYVFAGDKSVKIHLETEPAPDPDDPEESDGTFDRGIRLTHDVYLGRCMEGIHEARMDQIYALSVSIAAYMRDQIGRR